MSALLLIVLLSVIGGCVGALPVILTVAAVDMIRNPNLHYWPSVTRCRLCEKRIFAWQRYERRATRMETDNPNGVLFSVSGSALVHTACHGHPVMRVSVSVERRATS